MLEKWRLLAADLLEQGSDEFAKHVCNDFSFPKGWTKAEVKDFVSQMHAQNGTPEEFDPRNLSVPDWWVMAFLADELRAGERKGKRWSRG